MPTCTSNDSYLRYVTVTLINEESCSEFYYDTRDTGQCFFKGNPICSKVRKVNSTVVRFEGVKIPHSTTRPTTRRDRSPDDRSTSTSVIWWVRCITSAMHRLTRSKVERGARSAPRLRCFEAYADDHHQHRGWHLL